jgi:hypothetical protein
MPEISRFFGIIIRMYGSDHSPPHFHAFYGEHEALIAIETGELLGGRLPARLLKLVEAWWVIHQTELQQNWLTLAGPNKTFETIKPLQ